MKYAFAFGLMPCVLARAGFLYNPGAIFLFWAAVSFDIGKDGFTRWKKRN